MKKKIATICLAVALALTVGIITPFKVTAGDPPYGINFQILNLK